MFDSLRRAIIELQVIFQRGDGKSLMTQDPITEDIQEIMRNLVAYFVLRQQLVVLAVIELWPRSFYQAIQVENIDIRPYQQDFFAKFQEYREKEDKKQEDSPQIGIWKNDWRHFAHGIGCRLTHIQTGERLEWDAPNPKVFDQYWFINHLEWRLKNELYDPYVRQFSEWISNYSDDKEVILATIGRLAEKQIILSIGYRWILASDFVAPEPLLPDKVVSALLNMMSDYREKHVSNLELIDAHSFTSNANWRFLNDTKDENVSICLNWISSNLKDYQQVGSVENVTAISIILQDLVNRRIVTRIPYSKGLQYKIE